MTPAPASSAPPSSVVFYRNLNLGHRNSPDRATLEGALTEAGAREVRSFQTNGTVLFTAEDPTGVVAKAAARLRTAAGFTEPGMVRDLAELAAIMGESPFSAYDTSDPVRRPALTFFDGGTPLGVTLPWANPKDDVEFVGLYEGLVLSLVRQTRDGAAGGSPTTEVERLTGVPATTRVLGTVERLLKAAGLG
ncbi:DUF1697 domain-containing protein [Streptomyces sp. NPDC088745]|uniref:DUF1697 domain-containing protein n=1 Tax=Streptomyces sp. NPDC088745 TaxID=3365884 RepID=UPI00380F392D